MGTSAEVERNYRQFADDWWAGVQRIKAELDVFDARFAVSYRRLISLNAWRAHFAEIGTPCECIAFFVEAQNDALLSHVQARQGSWRLALKALRSTLENALYYLFYKDHSVELRQWAAGEHRLGAQELFTYVGSHPDLKGVDPDLTGLQVLREEYGLLSKAVHGSAVSFRMTADGPFPALGSADRARLGMWLTREKRLIAGINLLLVALFRDRLAGTALPGLRSAIGAAVPSNKFAAIRADFGVTLRA